MAKRYDSLLRLLLIGDTGVGKTCLICQYANKEFFDNHITTVGVDFKMKMLNVNGRTIKTQIWDTAGQERFEAITKQFYTRAQGCILVYDITSRSSFESLAKWLLYVKQYAVKNTAVIMIGNKADLESMRQVPKTAAQQFANENDLKFYETSAKDPQSLEQPFQDICVDILNATNVPPSSVGKTDSRVVLTEPETNSVKGQRASEVNDRKSWSCC